MSTQNEASLNEGSLYARIGGADAVNAAVEVFYRRVLSDPRIAHFFDSVDMDAQLAKQKAFLTMVFGGPSVYRGKDLRGAHAGLVARGLDDVHFNAVGEHLVGALRELNVPEALVAEVARVAESTRADVLGR